jgi:cation diffusion facilitator family transporter
VAHDHDHDHEHEHGVLATIKGVFFPHSHAPSDAVDRELEASAEGIRALKISLGALALTAVLQGVVVVMSGSVALFGDTLHNITDAMTALPLWLAFTLGRRAPDRRYTYGYGRAEDLAGVFIVVVIAASAAVVGWESVRRLLHPQDVEDLWAVAIASIIGFAGNEAVASYRIRVGRRIGSAALVADGLHARTDGLTSLAVLVGATGVALGWKAADPAVGIVITVAILGVLAGAVRDIYRRLMDAVDPELVDRVDHVLGHVDGIRRVSETRLRWIGHALRAEVRVEVDPGSSVVDAHRVAEDAYHRLLHEIPRLSDAMIHTDPSPTDGSDHHSLTDHHRRSE